MVSSSPVAISVIVPCRNGAGVLGAQLEALSRQRCDCVWEVIVVDNNSRDASKKIAWSFQARLPHLRVADAPNKRGAAYARNVGVRLARGENVAFCDADDEVAEGWLAAVERGLREHRAIAFRTDTHKLNPPDAERNSCQIDGLQQYTYPPYMPYSGSTIALRRELHLQLGGFDESMLACEDADFCWRLQHAGVPLHFVKEAVVNIRLRPTTRAKCRQARLWGEYNVVLYKKFRPMGMPALGRMQGIRNMIGVVSGVPRLVSRHSRASWLWQVSWAMGRLIGSIKHGIWAL
jgi:glycosyltransferase involved in cell wall biosynthesis